MINNINSENIVDKFYEDANKSMEKENAFESWEGQRNIINEMVRRIKDENGSFTKIAILGAGNCNDIDLKYLSSICKDITLFDIDASALERGVAKYSIEEECKIELVSGVEFTGLYEADFYNEFKQKLKECASIKSLSKFIRASVHKLNNDSLVNQYKDSYDFIISMPVYTQLCYPLCASILLDYVDNYKPKDIQSLFEEFNYLTFQSVSIYNDLIFAMGREHSKFFIITDVMEFTEINPNAFEAAKILVEKNDFKGLTNLMSSSHTISGGLKGLQDFLERNIEKQTTNFWMWPFLDNRSYLVYAIRGKKK